MRAHERAPAFDISIRGDELEYNRIQLEHNLQHTELSFRLSSTSDDEQHHSKIRHHRRKNKNKANESSVEYPRHLSEPSFHEFPSIVRSTGDHHADEYGQTRWSYRLGDDEEGINPYTGDTVSTAAHHASALTLSAGLGGGRGARRDASLSGAEYDPERPLHAMIAGVNSKHSMFDLDRSKSKAQGAASMTCDPLVVDSTAELDRILESGRAPPPSLQSRSVRVTSPASSASSFANEEVQPPPSPRPKLTDHLRHVSFSPKRPRSVQSNPISPFPRVSSKKWEDNASMNVPTPRPARRPNAFPSYASSPVQPEVRVYPSTPSSVGSKFSRMARGINQELEATQQQSAAERQSAPLVDRNPFHDVANQSQPATSFRRPTPRKSSMRDTSRGKVHLPDVTGLTTAVDTPVKPGAEYYSYRTDNRPRDYEARLLQTLSAVQSQLRGLEDENGISRRRVRELELELEECKRHVARERTRLIEREELNDMGYGKSTQTIQDKGKGRAVEPPVDIDDERLHERYKEAVDEKKALEALIISLRSHLTRLTHELASHQELLTELRNLRDSDSRALKEKSADILKLKEEVQRLAGEIEVLRGVVEEGLKERRASREIQIEHSVADVAMSLDLVEEQEEGNEDAAEEEDSDEILSDEEKEEPFDPVPNDEELSRVNQADRTMRTDFATVGSTNLAESMNSRRFVDKEELDHIVVEVEERRSNRSSSSSMESQSQPALSPSSVRRDRQATVEDEEEQERLPPASNMSHHPQTRPQTTLQPEPSSFRPSAPYADHSSKQAGPARFQERPEEPETPFPQIRGEHLERLFFSAPEHNAKTCTVCYRRRHRTVNSPWLYPRKGNHARNAAEDQEDEGFGEDSDEAADMDHVARNNKGKQRDYVMFSKDPGHWRQAARKEGLPPQTVVARVIRELEDDFTHYKSVYVELADQYKDMDAVSDVPRRNMLARHLREVVDILEQKGDQIASLYDLLSFKDKPITDSVIPDRAHPVLSRDKPHVQPLI